MKPVETTENRSSEEYGIPRWLLWPVFALVMGFCLGGSIFWGMFGPNVSNAAAIDSHEPLTPQRMTKEETDEALAKYTLWLAVLTGCLVLVSAGQGYFLLRADRTARMTAEAAQAQTYNFTKLERPYIYVFNVSTLELDSNREDPFWFVNYQVANYGKTPATIDGVFVGISVGSLPEPLHRVGAWHDLHVSPIMTPDQKRIGLTVPVPEPVTIGQYADEGTTPTPVPELVDDENFFVRVLIKYHGPFSKGHETSVCWRWETSSRRLVLYENDAFNFTI